jgi:PIN domain nuclease of toxin-antitoxin system
MSNKVVFDTSVIMALLNQEPGGEEAQRYIGKSIVSAVNIVELVSNLSLRPLPMSAIQQIINRMSFQIIPLSRELAELAGFLREQTRSAGLSLGDRACIALAIQQKIPVFTTDRAWAKFDFGIPVHLIR